MYLDRDARSLRPSLPVNGSFDGDFGKGLSFPEDHRVAVPRTGTGGKGF